MKNHRIKFLTLRLRFAKHPLGAVQAFGLLAVVLASACAPAVSSSPVAEATEPPVSAVTATLAATQPAIPPEATLTPTEAVLPVATARGPNLEATDPTTVALASGGLQLVEFFRFT